MMKGRFFPSLPFVLSTMNPMIGSVTPVSYTHLDVYKRQAVKFSVQVIVEIVQEIAARLLHGLLRALLHACLFYTSFAIPEAHYIQQDGIYAMVTVTENDITMEYTGKGLSLIHI